MKQFAPFVLVAFVVASPAVAQSSDEGGSDLMDRGMELLFEGLREEMSPAIDHMRRLAEDYGPSLFSFLDEMGPAFGKMLDDVKDWAAYHPPEILPNGDIIIRKKVKPEPKPERAPEMPVPDAEAVPQGQTDI